MGKDDRLQTEKRRVWVKPRLSRANLKDVTKGKTSHGPDGGNHAS
jgi:hypothetical protein